MKGFTHPSSGVESFVELLQAKPFVRSARLERKSDETPSIVLRTTQSSDTYRLRPSLVRSHVTYGLADSFIASATEDSILLAPYIAPPLAGYLGDKGVNFLDRAGNCRIVLGRSMVISMQGRSPPKNTGDRGLRAPGYAVILALLAEPEVVKRTVRDIAVQAGVSKSVVANVLKRLEAEGSVVTVGRGRELRRRDELLTRLLAGYPDVLRPRLLFGRYRVPETDPADVEARIENILGSARDWGWGGVSAGRRLGIDYSGPEVAVHVAREDSEVEAFRRQLRALESRAGTITILRMPGVLFHPTRADRAVHPLLTYLELAAAGNDRVREAAGTLREELLGHLSR